MTGDVVFYRLGSKMLERAEDVPKEAREVVYYSLAIGHHVGVFDCFEPMLRCSAEMFDRLVAALPAGEARRKFEGIGRFGEITVDRSHTRLLGGAIAEVRGSVDEDLGAWFDGFTAALAAIDREPAIYLMGRRAK
jgi:hydrogenase-4 component J